ARDLGGSGMPAVRRWAANLGLLVASLALSLVGAEIGFRVYLRHVFEKNSYERFVARQERGAPAADTGPYALERIIGFGAHPRLIYELRPHLHVPFGRVVVETNGAGMRTRREYAVARPPSTTRILGIGDSGMFGWDVPQGREYLAVLERRLGAR